MIEFNTTDLDCEYPLVAGEYSVSVYVDGDADIDMALSVLQNAKVSRPSVCNAAETLLVHKDIADILLPKVFPLMSTL